ncbi:MAG: hypothetical protein K6A40_08870 [Solobacterium sp.]|nr:hypothetical protein [Solobacterium sp.]
MSEYTKWVACWGNATSIREQTELRYTKDITLRYPIRMCFDGDALRFHFSNLTGTEPVHFIAECAACIQGHVIIPDTAETITVNGEEDIVIQPGQEMMSDEIEFKVISGSEICVSMYLEDYTQMNAGVLITGPLSRGYYSYGNQMHEDILPLDLTRHTNWFYFLNTVDVRTEENKHALVCFGDSITAQDWPDMLAIRAWENGFRDVSIIRRAVSGTRILREYSCITYAAYGIKGETRFPQEMNVAGCDTVLIQHGINDIIHPVGTDVNPWRPWSDLPTAEQMEEGYVKYYIEYARKLGLKVYGGTLIPIKGWRTYEPFREVLKNEFNDWLRTTDLLDGCVDFDLAVRDPDDPAAFRKEYDSGDHLHPSDAGYQAMADCVPEELLK